MKHSSKKILMIFIEPTPYILDLLEYGFPDLKNKCDVIFLTQNLTQNWNLQSYSIPFRIIQSKKQILLLLVDIFLKRRYCLLHIAGWSRPLTLFLILTSRFFFVPVTVESDTPLGLNTPQWKKIIKKVCYPVLFKFPAFFLPGGTRQAQYFNYYGVKNKKIINAQMTVDVDKIKKYVACIGYLKREELRLKYGSQKNNVVFLFVGRLLDWKGIRELISAVELIQDQRAKLWIVGSGELTDEVKLATQRCNKITYFGRVSGDLLWCIYHAADVFVIPSRSEPWGLVVNEAMASGLPIIATKNVGCINDLVLDKRHGIIVQPQNVTALLEALNYMLQNPEKRKLMAKNASEHIASWTLKNEAKNIMAAWGKSN